MTNRHLHLVLALPCLIVAGAALVLMIPVMARTPEVLNLSEAAALDNKAEVARLTEEGDDVNARRPIRAGLLDGGAHELTPLEAVVSIRRPEIIQYLVAHGARPAPERWPDLWCTAVRSGDPDVVAALEPVRPAGVDVDCEPQP